MEIKIISEECKFTIICDGSIIGHFDCPPWAGIGEVLRCAHETVVQLAHDAAEYAKDKQK